jgi:phage terminase large subunit-like protein
LTGVGWCGVLPDGRIAVSVMGFIAQNRAAEHMKSDKVPYLEWAKDGYCILTPGDVTDNSYVEDFLYTCETEDDKFHYANGRKAIEIDYDGHNANDMAIRMREHYNSEEMVIDIPQTCAALNTATKRFRELVISGGIVAEYSPLFEWCLSNAIEVKNSNGDIKLSKRYKDDTQRIDPVAGLMNALTRLIVKVDNKINVNRVIEERGYVLG